MDVCTGSGVQLGRVTDSSVLRQCSLCEGFFLVESIESHLQEFHAQYIWTHAVGAQTHMERNEQVIHVDNEQLSQLANAAFSRQLFGLSLYPASVSDPQQSQASIRTQSKLTNLKRPVGRPRKTAQTSEPSENDTATSSTMPQRRTPTTRLAASTLDEPFQPKLAMTCRYGQTTASLERCRLNATAEDFDVQQNGPFVGDEHLEEASWPGISVCCNTTSPTYVQIITQFESITTSDVATDSIRIDRLDDLDWLYLTQMTPNLAVRLLLDSQLPCSSEPSPDVPMDCSRGYKLQLDEDCSLSVTDNPDGLLWIQASSHVMPIAYSVHTNNATATITPLQYLPRKPRKLEDWTHSLLYVEWRCVSCPDVFRTMALISSRHQPDHYHTALVHYRWFGSPRPFVPLTSQARPKRQRKPKRVPSEYPKANRNVEQVEASNDDGNSENELTDSGKPSVKKRKKTTGSDKSKLEYTSGVVHFWEEHIVREDAQLRAKLRRAMELGFDNRINGPFVSDRDMSAIIATKKQHARFGTFNRSMLMPLDRCQRVNQMLYILESELSTPMAAEYLMFSLLDDRYLSHSVSYQVPEDGGRAFIVDFGYLKQTKALPPNATSWELQLSVDDGGQWLPCVTNRKLTYNYDVRAARLSLLKDKLKLSALPNAKFTHIMSTSSSRNLACPDLYRFVYLWSTKTEFLAGNWLIGLRYYEWRGPARPFQRLNRGARAFWCDRVPEEVRTRCHSVELHPRPYKHKMNPDFVPLPSTSGPRPQNELVASEWPNYIYVGEEGVPVPVDQIDTEYVYAADDGGDEYEYDDGQTQVWHT